MSSLSYLHTRLAVAAEGVDTGGLAFFDTHFTRRAGPAAEAPDATLVLRRTARPRVPPGADRIFIRRSDTEHWTVRAHRFGPPGELRLVCEASGTRIFFDVARRLIRLEVPRAQPGRELIEVVRSLVLRNEENRGVVVAQAAVVELDGRAVVIVGAQGTGKTSTALELVLRHGGRLVSGAKALVLPGSGGTGEVVVVGWPDWPHLGLGTISRFPELAERFSLHDAVAAAARAGDLWSTRHRVPLDPAVYPEVVPFAPPGGRFPVTSVVYPSLSPDAKARLQGCRPHGRRFALHVESSFDSGTFGWNPMVERSLSLPSLAAITVSRIGELPAFELSGDGSLTATDVARLLGG